ADRPAAPVHPSHHLTGAKDFTVRTSTPARRQASSPSWISSGAQRRTFTCCGAQKKVEEDHTRVVVLWAQRNRRGEWSSSSSGTIRLTMFPSELVRLCVQRACTREGAALTLEPALCLSCFGLFVRRTRPPRRGHI
uniref:Uncharacterized protein n=1 Tax=Gasterosteus aculeatus TaxID=69293 RepID=G3P251_GASAC